MNDRQLVHRYWAFLPPPGLLLHSLVEQALLGHSRVHHEHSAVMSKGNSFRHMEFMSKWNACIFPFITYVLDERYWMGPNQGYQKI
jgi:putative copper export protein